MYSCQNCPWTGYELTTPGYNSTTIDKPEPCCPRCGCCEIEDVEEDRQFLCLFCGAVVSEDDIRYTCVYEAEGNTTPTCPECDSWRGFEEIEVD